MKKIFVVLLLFAVVVAFGACGNDDSSGEHTLVGTWNWQGSEAFVFNEDGTYRWMGVDYGLLGFTWSSNGEGMVSYTGAGITTEWFRYEFTNANTLRIWYVITPGIPYTLQRAR